MAFALHYRLKTLARLRWEGNWLIDTLEARARKLGWDGKEPLRLYDSDGVAIAGIVPHRPSPASNSHSTP